MKDNNGFYYYPFPENKRVRMYVKEEQNTIYFRLWNSDDTMLWQEHGWIPYEAVRQATEIYDNQSGFDPAKTYDLNIAKAVLKESD